MVGADVLKMVNEGMNGNKTEAVSVIGCVRSEPLLTSHHFLKYVFPGDYSCTICDT